MQSDEEMDVFDINGKYISSSVCDDIVVLESDHEETLKKAFIKKILMENLKLRKELELFKCICGLSFPSPFVFSCVVTLQSAIRRFLAQHAFKKEKMRIVVFHKSFREWKYACKDHNRLKAALHIQSFIRGQRTRDSFEGKAVKRVLDMRRSTEDLEVLLLKLSTLHTMHDTIERNQIRVV